MEGRMRKQDQAALIQDLAQALSRAERCVLRRLAAAFDEECTVEQWRILLLLADTRGHAMSELADFALVPAPSLTRLIDRMTTDGLVYRTVDLRDRRRVLVHMTERGRALHRSLGERVERQQDLLVTEGQTDEAQRLLALLERVVERLR
jgi:DNA-binding MarR family transcriptional regulator